MLNAKKILLGITGSIAAYKSILLLRFLVKEGAEVRVIMTPAARDFVSPLTLSTLSGHPVAIDLFHENEWSNHVLLGRWADLMLVAPLSCNTLAKMAIGACDNLLMAVYLSATCPVIVAPAMDEDMWKHPSTQQNLQKIISYGNKLIPVERGDLASGLVGEGRMAEPESIMDYIKKGIIANSKLAGKKALVTAGPTHEAIDPVRFLGNNSSGKMGVSIARQLQREGAEVTLVLGPTEFPLSLNGMKVIRVNSAEEMYKACTQIFPDVDIAVMAAAVADYMPEVMASEKIKKKDENLTLVFKRTPDILKSLGKSKRPGQVLVGFALETQDEKKNALEKLQSKNADLMVLNSLRDEGAGFRYDANKVTIFDSRGNENSLPLKDKSEIAKDIVDSIIEYVHG
jgi:phosphopantothenoylcysteine decarboxylase/phosphopantothenate--cysteine ligase